MAPRFVNEGRDDSRRAISGTFTNPTSSARSPSRSPRIPHYALAGVALGDARKLALERGGGGPAVQPLLLGGGGDERGVACLPGAIDDEGCAWQRLERRT